MKHQKRISESGLGHSGFTLAELIIIIAIVAVLVALALPIFANALDSSRAGTCDSNRKALLQQTVTGYVTDQYDSMEDSFTAALAANPSAYACPSGGTLSYSAEDGLVCCSKHAEATTPEQAVDGFLHCQVIQDYLAPRVSSANTEINSEANREGSFAIQAREAMKEAGLDVDAYSFRIWARKGCNVYDPAPDTYNVFIGPRLSADDIGQTVTVTKFDVGAGTSVTGTIKVLSKTDGGGTNYPAYNASTFKPN